MCLAPVRIAEFAKNSLGIDRNDDIKSKKTILIDNYNIESNDKEFKITFEITNIRKEDIKITANDNKLQVKINDHEKKDVKVIELPNGVNMETAKFTYKMEN